MQVIKWFLYLSFLLIMGCSKSLDIHKTLIWEGATINIHFTALSHPKSESNYRLLFGDAEFSNYGVNIKSVNLNCLFTSIGDFKSDQIYVSSIASFFTKGYPLSENLTLIPLYWTINKTVDDTEIDTLTVYVKEGCRLLSEIDWKKDRQWEKDLPTVDQEIMNGTRKTEP